MLTVNSQWDEWEWIFFPKWGWWQRWKACKRFFVSRRRYNNIARRDVESERGIAVVWLVNGMNLIRLPNKKLNNAIRRGGIPCMKHSRDIYLSPVFKRPEFFNVPDKTGHVGKGCWFIDDLNISRVYSPTRPAWKKLPPGWIKKHWWGVSRFKEYSDINPSLVGVSSTLFIPFPFATKAKLCSSENLFWKDLIYNLSFLWLKI